MANFSIVQKKYYLFKPKSNIQFLCYNAKKTLLVSLRQSQSIWINPDIHIKQTFYVCAKFIYMHVHCEYMS